jgi:mRNA-degrading endonuclease YafQ of YafQ-DinJ toxin-antitoxin module
MYTLFFSTQFKKDYKRCVKRGYDISLLENALKNSERLVVYLKNIDHIF